MTDLTATAGFGGTLNWYSDPGLTTNIGTGATLTPGMTMGTTIYYVTESVGTCVSPASQVSITITNCCDLSASSVITDETCDAQNDGSVDFTITGSATYDIIIDGNTEFNDVNAGNYNWTNLSDGSYSVQIVNIADPTCDTTFNVVVNPGAVVAITAEASTDLTDCTAPNGTITITSTGTTYELFTSAGVSVGTNATGAFTGLGAGDYYVVVSDGTCSATGSTLTINDLTASTSNTINNSVCNGDVYTFVDGSQQTITSNTSLVSILTNSVGCDSIVTENITVLQPYTVIVDTTVCEGTNYTFADNSNHVNILMDQTHTSNLTASNGCDSTVIENVTVIPNPTLDLAPSISGCEGMPIVITATTNGGTPTWNTGDVSNSITYTGTVDTFFVASVFGTCDTISDTIFVNILPPPTVDAGADVTVPLGGTVELEATSTDPNVYYTWSPSTYLSCTDCAITEAGPLGTITYIVEVTDENGCMAYDTVTVTIDGEIGLYIPNIFSPNNDGENDVFHIYGPSWKHYKLEIYNRWGGLVFSTETPGEGWDGKTNGGEECPQAVFVYKFWGGSTVGMSFERAGNVMLTR
jgi:gliding motility-associated-like protein